MAVIKSSSEHLTLNADGAGKDIKFQANGVEKASISSAGAFTSTSIDATKLSGALPAISGSALTGLKAGSCAFRVKHDAAAWGAIPTNTKIVLANEHEDSDGVYNTSSGHFTAPAAGVYFFYANIYVGEFDTASGFRFRRNDSSTAIEDFHGSYGSYMSQSDASDCMISWQLVITLSANDTISVWTGTQSDIYYGHSYWGGFRLS